MKEDRMEDGTGREEGRQNCSKGKNQQVGGMEQGQGLGYCLQ